MANYNNYPKKQYAKKQYPKKQYTNTKKPSGDGFKTVVAVLVIFLLIGLIGSVFSRPSADTNTNETQPPTTSVTDPTEETTDSTEAMPELITFTYCGRTFTCEAGMTWAEFVESDYNTESFVLNAEGNRIVAPGDNIVSYEENDDPVSSQDVIVSGGSFVFI